MPKNALAPNVLMVFPRFNPNSFWSLAPVCAVWGARCPAPPLGLITLAAMLPPAWNVRLVNRNSEELTAADLDWADLVMIGEMLPQQDDTLASIALALTFQDGSGWWTRCDVQSGGLPRGRLSGARRSRSGDRRFHQGVVGQGRQVARSKRRSLLSTSR
jgi:hypothetical protein